MHLLPSSVTAALEVFEDSVGAAVLAALSAPTFSAGGWETDRADDPLIDALVSCGLVRRVGRNGGVRPTAAGMLVRSVLIESRAHTAIADGGAARRRLLELARDLNSGLLHEDGQKALGNLLADAALWPGNPLSGLSPAGAVAEEKYGDVLDLLQLLLKERGHRTDGDMVSLAVRCLHLSRGDVDLQSLQAQIIGRLKSKHAGDVVNTVTPAMWDAGQSAFARWVTRAYADGRPDEPAREEGVRLAIAAMEAAAAGGNHG